MSFTRNNMIMRKNIIQIPALALIMLGFWTGLNAEQLDGLWKNVRQNITIRIEQDNDGIRAKRSDQGVWYRYEQQREHVFTDRNGNTYEVIQKDQLQWKEAGSGKRIIFTRVDSSDGPRWSSDKNDPAKRDKAKWNDKRYQARSPIAGRWYDRSTKERLIIEPIDGAYRVRTQHGGWETYAVDRSGERLKSRSGNMIQLIDRNTIRVKAKRDREERIYIRQGNGHAKGKKNGHRKDHRTRSHKE